MNPLAHTYLRQGRSFLHAGDAQRSVDLLEKARAMARDDATVLDEVLQDLADAYARTGQAEKADRCRAQIRRYDAPAGLPPTPSSTPATGNGSGGVPIWFVVAAGVLIAVAGVVVWLTAGRNDPLPNGSNAADTVTTVERGPATAEPTPTPANPPAPATAPGARGFPPASPATAPTRVTTIFTDDPQHTPDFVKRQLTTAPSLEARVKDHVGLVVAMAHYEGNLDGKFAELDLPLAYATAFAATVDGRMITSRTVARAMNDPAVPTTLQPLDLPSLALKGTRLVVAFGPETEDRVAADVVYASDRFDVAVLRVARSFEQPFALSGRAPRLHDSVHVAGVRLRAPALLDAGFARHPKVVDLLDRFRFAHAADALAGFAAPAQLHATAPRGIVTVAERQFDGARVAQFDAPVGPTGAGGPLIDADGRVAGVVAQAPSSLGDYKFALLPEQFLGELAPHLAVR